MHRLLLFYIWCSCGEVQTGSFLDGAAPNGLSGLGMENVSVPSILASKGLAANFLLHVFWRRRDWPHQFWRQRQLQSGRNIICFKFDSVALYNPHASDSSLPFEYCYDIRLVFYPQVILTMQGGDQFNVMKPIILAQTQTANLSCLAIVKSGDVNIIGQISSNDIDNFMTGYRIVFDRDKKALGWNESN
ncbi:hypothetical protein RJ641_010733, partial [Dillenia turbinata]